MFTYQTFLNVINTVKKKSGTDAEALLYKKKKNFLNSEGADFFCDAAVGT